MAPGQLVAWLAGRRRINSSCCAIQVENLADSALLSSRRVGKTRNQRQVVLSGGGRYEYTTLVTHQGNGLQTKIYLDLSICGTSSCNLFIEIVWPTALTAIHALPYKPCRPCPARFEPGTGATYNIST